MEQVIKELLQQVLGGSAEVELVVVPPGKTIEQVMTEKGYKPDGDRCGGCGEQHGWVSPDGKKIGAFPEEESEITSEAPTMTKADEKKAFNERRARALEGIRKRQAKVLRMYDILKAMEKSIEQPRKDRDIGDLIREVGSYAELQMLAREL